MTPLTLAGQIDRLTAAAAITAEDVMALRGLVWGGDNRISPGEALALARLDETAGARAPEWLAFYVEALTEFVVYQREPRGYVDEAGADWLITAVAHDGRARGGSEIEVLAHVLEAAEAAPPRLAAFAMAQVKAGVLADGRITGREVELLRRVLYACAGEGNIAITRAETEALFDINDACRGAENDPAWSDLFAKAVIASVMTVSGYRNSTADEERHRQLWLNAPDSLGAFFGRMTSGMGAVFSSPSSMWQAMRNDDTDAGFADVAADEAARKAAEPVDAGEAAWLAARIARDGAMDPGELQVLTFLRENSPKIDPALRSGLEAAMPERGTPAPFGHRGAA